MFFQGQDQAGFNVSVKSTPQRIICTVPSLTELLYDLGLEEKIVGVTRFCVKPAIARKKAAIIGGTKDLDLELIKTLKPDLIIGNKEENIKEQILTAKKTAPVWLSDINGIKEACEAIQQIGEITGTSKKANEISDKINSRKNVLSEMNNSGKSVLYFIWKNPYMLAGKNTYINSILELCGLQNIAPKVTNRYPEISLEQIQSLRPDVLILSSEPYPFSSGDLHHLAKALPAVEAYILNGEVFSWYGSRLIPGLEYLRSFKNQINRSFHK